MIHASSYARQISRDLREADRDRWEYVDEPPGVPWIMNLVVDRLAYLDSEFGY